MKKLNSEHIFILSEIVEKMDFKMPDSNDKTQQQYGAELILEFFKKLHKAKKEINTLIVDITGKRTEDMSISELKDTFKELFNQEGVMDFFK